MSGAQKRLLRWRRPGCGLVRPAEAALHLLLELGRREEAGQRLDELEKLRPGDPDLVSWRSLLDQGSVRGPAAGSGDARPAP